MAVVLRIRWRGPRRLARTGRYTHPGRRHDERRRDTATSSSP